MANASRGHVVAAVLIGGLGLVALALAYGGGASLPGVLGLPGSTLALVTGWVLAFSGLLLLVIGRKKAEAPGPTVPAHVAFAARHAPIVFEPDPTPRPRSAPAVAPIPEVAMMETRIRELTREINRAGVMLATGKLSSAGYGYYVDKLKAERSELEAAKLDFELGRVSRAP